MCSEFTIPTHPLTHNIVATAVYAGDYADEDVLLSLVFMLTDGCCRMVTVVVAASLGVCLGFACSSMLIAK